MKKFKSSRIFSVCMLLLLPIIASLSLRAQTIPNIDISKLKPPPVTREDIQRDLLDKFEQAKQGPRNQFGWTRMLTYEDASLYDLPDLIVGKRLDSVVTSLNPRFAIRSDRKQCTRCHSSEGIATAGGIDDMHLYSKRQACEMVSDFVSVGGLNAKPRNLVRLFQNWQRRGCP